MPTCGKCKATGQTVEHIRACYGGPSVKVREILDRHAPVEFRDGPAWPPSEGQVKYVLGLQDERRLPDDYRVKDRAIIESMERDDVSGVINLLKTFAKKEGAKQQQWSMPEGRYALEVVVEIEWGDKEWRFYQVDKPTEGRWAGYTFIKQLIGAPGQYRKENVNAVIRDNILKRIEEDPKQAMIDYGLQSQVCGRCSSPLSDKDSLARGLGPDCARKSGWF